MDYSSITHDHDLEQENMSTITIVRRHPMHDCLFLVKRYRPCINGYSLEFPTVSKENVDADNDCKTRLVSIYIDGDDPIQHSMLNASDGSSTSAGEPVHVPVNGLIDRLEHYKKAGIIIDSRVCAFAIGLETAERMLIINSIKEPQETPI